MGTDKGERFRKNVAALCISCMIMYFALALGDLYYELVNKLPTGQPKDKKKSASSKDL
ncbi:hypothetical protein [Candidatus Ichthyocystis hellenicum]|uniref:hypothetical protein n=1 Tax=Candidatus Ichthyocystis hellenicum TaxID=1561003 RepID=UPI001584C1EC|nr:hypothetical protein [Candidatus Ichthyocystis hellenicum]